MVILLALYPIKYSLNYSSARPAKNNPIYVTWSTTNSNFAPLFLILSYIYIRNPLSLIFLLLSRLIDGILIFNAPILLILTFSAYLLPISQSTTT